MTDEPTVDWLDQVRPSRRSKSQDSHLRGMGLKASFMLDKRADLLGRVGSRPRAAETSLIV